MPGAGSDEVRAATGPVATVTSTAVAAMPPLPPMSRSGAETATAAARVTATAAATVTATAAATVTATAAATVTAAGSTPREDVPVESPEDAVRRLAEARALAFDQATVQALARVDEPGSPAMIADAALVARLNAQGLRLQGLTFRVSGVRVVSAPTGRTGQAGRVGRPVVMEVTVVTSAHRRVGARDGVVAATVGASPPRRVRLTLAPAPDGRHWLVRDAADLADR
jgi:hypothetical protein